MSILEYTARPQFIPFHQRVERWASLNTHRRAGKTVALINDMVEKSFMCPHRKPQYAYIGPTFTQAKRIAWVYAKDYTEKYWSKAPQESELKITMKNEATLHILGADNADALRGMYLDGAVMDEYAMFRPSVFSQVIRPALSDRTGWGVFASTPRGKNLFYHTQTQAEKDPAWYALTLKASLSGIIPPRELEELRRQMDPEEFAQEYECSFDAALKGAIYAAEVDLMFRDRRVVPIGDPTLYDHNLPTHFVFDLGFTDATIRIGWQIKNGRVNVVSCKATTGVDIFQHIEELHEFTGEVGDVWLPHDAKAKNLQTGLSIVEQFLKEGIRPRIVPSHKVRDGIAAARRVFPTVYIEEATTGDLVEALKAYRREWNDDLGMFSDRPVHDWASDYSDCFRYLALVCDTGATTSKSILLPSDPHDIRNLDNLFRDNESKLGLYRRIS